MNLPANDLRTYLKRYAALADKEKVLTMKEVTERLAGELEVSSRMIYHYLNGTVQMDDAKIEIFSEFISPVIDITPNELKKNLYPSEAISAEN